MNMAEKSGEKTSKFEEILETYKTEASLKGAEKREEKQRRLTDVIESNVLKFLIKKNGKSDEEEGTPKSYKLNGSDDAHELVLEIGKSVLKQKFPKLNKEAIAELAKDEHFLMSTIDEAMGRQGYAHQLVKSFADYGGNITSHAEYDKIKKHLAYEVSHKKYIHAKQSLTHNTEKRSDIEKLVNKALEAHGKHVKATVTQEELVEHLGNMYHEGGKFNESYVQKEYVKHFKNAPKPK